MRLRAGNKRKATQELLLYREQRRSTKRTRGSEAQHDEGYSLRSKPSKLQQQNIWLMQAQRKKKKSPQMPATPRPLRAEPGEVPLMRQFRSRRLSSQQKRVTVSRRCSPARRRLVVPARRSLRIDAQSQLLQQQERVVKVLATRRTSRRRALPHESPSNLADCQVDKSKCSFLLVYAPLTQSAIYPQYNMPTCF